MLYVLELSLQSGKELYKVLGLGMGLREESPLVLVEFQGGCLLVQLIVCLHYLIGKDMRIQINVSYAGDPLDLGKGQLLVEGVESGRTRTPVVYLTQSGGSVLDFLLFFLDCFFDLLSPFIL